MNQNSAQKCSFCSPYWYFSLDILLGLGLGVGIRISQNITCSVLFCSGAAGVVQQSHNPDILISSFETSTVWGFLFIFLMKKEASFPIRFEKIDAVVISQAMFPSKPIFM